MAPSTAWTVAVNLEPQTNKTAIVTGANSGVGYEAALHLALRGAHVTMAVRSVERGEAAAATIRKALAAAAPTAGTVTVAQVDVGDLSSVRAFAASFLASHTALHILLNNAGVMMLPRSLSPDGQEVQMATNHLGHFALTGLLLPLLAATPGARVVNVSSTAHWWCKDLALDDWTLERDYTPVSAYARSKVANVLFTRELARRLAARRTPVLAVTAQPGWAITALVSKASMPTPGTIFEAIFRPFLSHSAEAGAAPLLLAATEAGVAADDYWTPRFFDMKGVPVAGKKSALAMDDAAAAALWAKSEEVTGVSYLN